MVKYLGHKEGHLISKLDENLGDTDIKNFTVSPLYQIKCNAPLFSAICGLILKPFGLLIAHMVRFVLVYEVV